MADETERSGYQVDSELAATVAAGLETVNAPPDEPVVRAARHAGEALRRVVDRVTATSAPPEVLDAVAEQAQVLVDMLAPYSSVRDYRGASEASGLAHGRAFFDWSPMLGIAHPLAPPLRVAVEDGIVVARGRFGIAYEGPPGCVHGGFIAAAFDEVLGLTQSLAGQVGMTGTLTVKYRRPTPLHSDLRFEGRVESVSGRKVTTVGRLLAGEDTTAEATGLFITISPERFSSFESMRERPDG